MAVFKNGIFAVVDGQIVNPTSNLVASIPCANFFTAARVLNITQRSAIYQLVSDLQSYSIWDKMKAVYPFVGQSGASSSFELNLKDVSTFRGTFNGGWTFASTGVTGNGTNTFMNTGFITNGNVLSNSTHYSIYSRTNLAENSFDIGIEGTGRTMMTTRYGDNSCYYAINKNIYAYSAFGGIANSLGFYNATTVASSVSKLFKNGTVILSGNTDNVLSTIPIYIGAFNNQGTGAAGFSNRQYAFASIGDGLTDTEAANLYTAVQRFQTTLGRQV